MSCNAQKSFSVPHRADKVNIENSPKLQTAFDFTKHIHPEEYRFTPRKKRVDMLSGIAAAYNTQGPKAALAEAVSLMRANSNEPVYSTEAARHFFCSGHTNKSKQILEQTAVRHNDPFAVELLAFHSMHDGDISRAIELFATALRQNPARSFSHINLQALTSRIRQTKQQKEASVITPQDVTIATSLPPKNITITGQAVDSWLRYGFKVISVNTEQEYGLLAQHFPDIQFCIQNDTAREITGKDHQYLDALLDALAASNSPVCGIINADIVLQGGSESWLQIIRYAQQNFIYSSRINVSGLDVKKGLRYDSGFDWFLFPSTFTPRVPRTKFVLGAPFWDLFFPAWAFFSGYITAICYSPMALHITHPTNWAFELFISFGRYILECFSEPFAALLDRHAGTSAQHEALAFFVAELFTSSITGAAHPFFCHDPMFANFIAPVDPTYLLRGSEQTAVAW